MSKREGIDLTGKMGDRMAFEIKPSHFYTLFSPSKCELRLYENHEGIEADWVGFPNALYASTSRTRTSERDIFSRCELVRKKKFLKLGQNPL